MATPSALCRLTQLGQSVWLDYIERGFVKGGDLARLIAEDCVSGLTSNPAIFQKAFAEGRLYQEEIHKLAREGLDAHEIHEALVIEDIRDAADVLAAVHDRTAGIDGYVSLEVSPHLAGDAVGTISEAKRLWALVDRRNLMIKVPGTIAGLIAIRRLIADGINVNVTLLFSVERYTHVLEQFISGLEDRVAAGQDSFSVASVASFFLSRIDTIIDARIDAQGNPELAPLRGQFALACAHAAYHHYRSVVSSSRWHHLVARGARPQRLLWASTGTKDPAYSDVKYVEALIAPETITTLPPETLVAYRDHGKPAVRLTPESIAVAAGELDRLLHRLAAAGIDWSSIAHELEEQGIRKFIEPHDAALAALQAKIAETRGSSAPSSQ